jgi:hypothetical protein
VSQGENNSRKTECPQGHPYDEENTVVYRGKRSCRTCARANSRVQSIKKHGLTVEAYDEMMAAREGVCDICGERDEIRLALDHDHNCCPGRVSCGKCLRGLLCRSCNKGLGHFGDDPARLEAALRYLS